MTVMVDGNCSKFGKLQGDIMEIASLSALPIVKKFRESIDMVIVSSSYSGEINNITGVNNRLTTSLSLDDIPSIRIENTSAGGSSAIFAADSFIRAGKANSILVVGVERMTSLPTREVAGIIASLLPEEERMAGITLPSLGSFLAARYMEKYGTKRESIANVAVKNHHNGSLNPTAHFRYDVSIEDVMNSKIISDPLRLYEFCPISDGSASVLLMKDDLADSFSEKSMKLIDAEIASTTSSILERADILSLESVKRASQILFKKTGMEARDVDLAELHDMSSILEIVESEAIGFFENGTGGIAVDEGITSIEGELPINTSGGLISHGHPVGATGVAQTVEIFLQLTGRAGKRQVKGPEYGLTLNMSGFGNEACTTLWSVR